MEEDEDVMRRVEIRPGQTFHELGEILLKSINFDNKHEASFYVSDDLWRKGREISKSEKKDARTGNALPIMEKAKINAFVNDPHQKFVFVYDYEVEWTFLIELTGISRDESANTEYPRLIKSVGKAPKQYRSVQKIGSELEDDEYAYLTTKLLAKEEVEANMDIVADEDMAEVPGEEGEETETEEEDEEMADEEGYEDAAEEEDM